MRSIRPGDQLQGEASGGLADLGAGVGDRGEGRVDLVDRRRVVVPHEGHVARADEAVDTKDAERSEGHQVVVGEDRRRQRHCRAGRAGRWRVARLPRGSASNRSRARRGARRLRRGRRRGIPRAGRRSCRCPSGRAVRRGGCGRGRSGGAPPSLRPPGRRADVRKRAPRQAAHGDDHRREPASPPRGQDGRRSGRRRR